MERGIGMMHSVWGSAGKRGGRGGGGICQAEVKFGFEPMCALCLTHPALTPLSPSRRPPPGAQLFDLPAHVHVLTSQQPVCVRVTPVF